MQGIAYRSTISPRSFSILTAGFEDLPEFGDELGFARGQEVVQS